VAHLLTMGEEYRNRGPLVLCLSGRGDKDVVHVARLLGRSLDEVR
jgi:tryptophan synthase beta subunit